MATEEQNARTRTHTRRFGDERGARKSSDGIDNEQQRKWKWNRHLAHENALNRREYGRFSRKQINDVEYMYISSSLKLNNDSAAILYVSHSKTHDTATNLMQIVVAIRTFRMKFLIR